MKNDTTMRTPLKRVRGLGSAKAGVHHWWNQRLSAVAMVPLMLWAIFTVATLPGLTYADALMTLQQPVNATLLILFLGAGFWHASLGLQVVIEDYVSREGTRMVLITAIKGGLILIGALAIFSVLRIAL